LPFGPLFVAPEQEGDARPLEMAADRGSFGIDSYKRKLADFAARNDGGRRPTDAMPRDLRA
jgi:hypothetical protein